MSFIEHVASPNGARHITDFISFDPHNPNDTKVDPRLREKAKKECKSPRVSNKPPRLLPRSRPEPDLNPRQLESLPIMHTKIKCYPSHLI